MNREGYKQVIMIAAIALLFGAGFALFFRTASEQQPEESRPVLISPAVVGKPLPTGRLVDNSGAVLDDSMLRNGKVLLVFVTPDCSYCLDESKFLSTLMHKRSDIRYYGVLVYSSDRDILKYVESKFSFKIFLDEGALLRTGLGLRGVPVKLYLENGIAKKTWTGSTLYSHTEDEFAMWIESLPR